MADVDAVHHVQEYLQHAVFVPGGGIVFVKQNNIFYKPNMTSGGVYQVTVSGIPGTVYNGVADWLYEGGHNFQGNTISSSEIFQRKFLVRVKHFGFPQTDQD